MAIITPPVDAGLAAWLKSEALYVAATDSNVSGTWGDKAIDTTIVSGIAFRAPAIAEAARQLQFLGGPLVADEHVVTGLRHELIGRRIKLQTRARQPLGYDGDGAVCFVIGASEDSASEMTTLTVLRRLDLAPPPPPSDAAFFIIPTASGDQSGSDWSNAASLGALETMIAKADAVGGEVRVRADAGPYSYTGTLTLTRGGVVVRGVDVNGNDMKAEIVGSRPNPWSVGAAYGNELFRLNAGADNLTFRNFRFRNIGGGCFRVRQPIANLTVEDVEAYNIGRFIQNLGVTSSTDATIDGMTVRRIHVEGISKTGFVIRYNSRNVLIEDAFFDFQNISGDWISTGFTASDKAHDIIVRRMRVVNVYNAGPGRYYNGDGFSSERGTYNHLFEDCSAENISDGGVDFKADQVTMVRFVAKLCKRSYRLWGDCLLVDCVSDTPQTRGGTGASCHIIANPNGKTRIRIQGGQFIQTNSMPLFRGSDNSLLVWDQAALDGISNPAGATRFVLDIGDDTDALSGLWDHNDTTAPTITGHYEYLTNPSDPTGPKVKTFVAGLNMAMPENKPQSYLLAVSENANLRVRGADASQVAVIGRELSIKTQNYEKPGGPAADGSKVLKFEVQAFDPNDNASPWMPVNVEILDVPDDPISAQDAVGISSASGGFWYDLADTSSQWMDYARTIPAGLGDPVSVLDDLTGFGNHCTFPQGYEPILREDLKGYRYLEFTGENYGFIGPVGGLRFPQLTAAIVFHRDKGDYETGVTSSSAVISTGRRNLTDTTTSNTMFAMEVVDSAYCRVRTSSQNFGINNGFNHTTPHILSYRSVDGMLRSDGAKLQVDGPDVAAISYARTTEQPLLGARYAHDGSIVSIMEGRFYAAMMLNRTLDDDTRARVELQLAGSAGITL